MHALDCWAIQRGDESDASGCSVPSGNAELIRFRTL
jgi:hypothetical protein